MRTLLSDPLTSGSADCFAPRRHHDWLSLALARAHPARPSCLALSLSKKKAVLMEESQGQEGKCVCWEGHGGTAKHKSENNFFLIGVSWPEAVATHTVPEEQARRPRVTSTDSEAIICFLSLLLFCLWVLLLWWLQAPFLPLSQRELR